MSLLSRVDQLSTSALTAALRDKRILIIGGTAGIGKALAVSCQRRGAYVTVVGRRPWTDSALGNASGGVLFPAVQSIPKDLSLMRNASALALELNWNTFDWIVFTNGIFAAPKRQLSSEGIELDMAVSFLSRYVFLKTILAKSGTLTVNSRGSGTASITVNTTSTTNDSQRSPDPSSKTRVFIMGFPGAKVNPTLDDWNGDAKYSALPAHMNTVAANEALVLHFATHNTLGSNSNIYGLAPGLIKTEIRDNLFGKNSWKSRIMETIIGWFTPTAEQYVENNLLHILASPQLENNNGLLIDHKRNIIQKNPFFNKQENVEKVMEQSDKLMERALEVSS